ncbi:MAG TPA: EAL domain-containing protein [Gemmatimonadales bacterium]|jgi:diguanylate cyclase (GGDEF)-like protein/PAS domain S-box-containing protein|nr:EAL domain-containing protein [Gemmatimonadales bacterium]
MIAFLSFLFRVAALALALVLWWRQRDWRMGMLFVLLLFMALPATLLFDGAASGETVGITPDQIAHLLVSASALMLVFFLDGFIAEQRCMSSALALEKASLEQLFESAPDALVLVDNDSRILRLNSHFTKLFGYTVEEVRGDSVDDLLAPEALQDEAAKVTHQASRGARISLETLRRRRDGSVVDVSILGTPIIVNGQQVAIYGSYRDITQRKRVEQALRESEERYALAARGSNDGLWDWDFRRNRIYFSPRWKVMLGLNENDVADNPEEWFGRVHPEDLDRVKAEIAAHCEGGGSHLETEHRMRLADGAYRWMLVRGIVLRDEAGKAYRMAGSQTDISDRKLYERQLQHDALHDALTGLPNRTLFMDRLGHALARARRRPDELFTVLFLDLDRFKVVNDSLGHLLGDRLLVEFARRMERCVRPGDTVSRLGGDEFTILLEDLRSPDEAIQIAERIHAELLFAFNLSGTDVFTSASIGIAHGSADYGHADQLLRDADTAMYRAKSGGKARHEVFQKAMHADVLTLLHLETDLRRAVERAEFTLDYQPIMDLESQRMIGFEALIRWHHPQRGTISPSEFILTAEETGLIVPIGWWVLKEACQQMQAWHTRFPEHQGLSISVNLSARLFRQAGLHERVVEVVASAGLHPTKVKLEITESALMDYAEASVLTLRQLKHAGIQVQIDDFGTGYSSLNYLQRFEIDALKIDRSFVSQLGIAGENSEIARTIITLARNLGMKVVAEGIETDIQLAQLQALGCDEGQGYLLSHPLKPFEVEQLLQEGDLVGPRFRRPIIAGR